MSEAWREANRANWDERVAVHLRAYDLAPLRAGKGRLHPIVALEVEWSAVAGIDFTFLLHADARLVLEARHVTKRLFNSMEDVKCFYDCGSATSPDGVAMTCGAAWMAQGPGRDKQYSAQGSGRDKQYSAARVQHPV